MSGKRNIKIGLRAVIATAALAAAFVLPAQAFAAEGDCANAGSDPTAAQYCSVSGTQAGNGNEQGPVAQQDETQGVQVSNSPAPVASAATVESSSQGSLPFTGLDVGILVLVAAILVGTGLALRRLTASGIKQG